MSTTVLVEALRREGRWSYPEFVRWALYHPEHGYYRRQRQRVGTSRGTDFATNLSVRSLLAPLVRAALEDLLAPDALAAHGFLEIGAEPGEELFQAGNPGFRECRVAGVGAAFPRLEGPWIVFANEVLDAQPFVRLVFRSGEWREVFVAPAGEGEADLCEVEDAVASADGRRAVDLLPPEAPEGYRFDLSVEAEDRLGEWLAGPWTGSFLTLDYGSEWEALARHLPAGTARSYRNHREEVDLLKEPAERDLTCNVCWDRLAAALAHHGFAVGGPVRQEAFFLQHAQSALQPLVEDTGPGAWERKSQLQQLLHPAHFGAAFQALWGIRQVPGTRGAT